MKPVQAADVPATPARDRSLSLLYFFLHMQTNQPYFLQLSAINRAGDNIQSQLGPIFVDSSEPIAGLVVDGTDFRMDLTDSGDRGQVTGWFIIHLHHIH